MAGAAWSEACGRRPRGRASSIAIRGVPPRLADRRCPTPRDAGDRPLGDRGAGGSLARPDGARRARASRGLSRRLVARRAAWSVVCGKGNNGGDGLVVARLLREAGREVTVLCAAPPDEFTGDAHANLERLPGEARRDCWPTARARCAGARGGDRRRAAGHRLRRASPAAPWRRRSRRSTPPVPPVVSVDVPSGVDASTGAVAGAAVRASATVTFHAAKPGLWISPGKAHAGEVRDDRHRHSPRCAGAGRRRADRAAVLGVLPRRGGDSTKFSSGHVLVAGGSRGLDGAPRMAALASMRAGAGYVTACVPAVAAGRPRRLRAAGADDPRRCPTTRRRWRRRRCRACSKALGRGGALALGPGLGRATARSRSRASSRARPRSRWCSTPTGSTRTRGHLGELAARDAADGSHAPRGRAGPAAGAATARRSSATACATCARPRTRAQAVVVLKGDDTLVADPTGAWR